jgi:cellulose biosynthesis protein BcsQ
MRRGSRVLAIDMDPQGQLGKVLGLEVRRPRHSAIELLVNSILGDATSVSTGDSTSGFKNSGGAGPRLPITSTRTPNLDIIVANKSLALFPTWTGAATQAAIVHGSNPPVVDPSFTAATRPSDTEATRPADTEATRPADTEEARSVGEETRLAVEAAARPTLEASLAGEDDPTGRLSRTLDASPDSDLYEYILFDAPPSFGPLTLNILRACDEIVIPVPLTYLALDGCAEMMRTVEMVRSRYPRADGGKLQVSMVIPMFYRRTRMANEILAQLQQRFSKELSQSIVGYHVKIDEAQSRGLSIFEYAPKDKSARAMAALAEELEMRGLEP